MGSVLAELPAVQFGPAWERTLASLRNVPGFRQPMAGLGVTK